MTDKDQIISSIHRHYSKKEDFILLESQMKNHPSSTVSFIAAGSKTSIRAYGNKIHLLENGSVAELEKNPWEAFQDFRTKYPMEWMFGFLGYDLKNSIEDLVSENPASLEAPDLYFFIPELVVKISDDRVEVIKGELSKDLPMTEIEGEISIISTHQLEKEKYLEKIITAQNSIREGDFYEINISHPLEFKLTGQAWDLYKKMKAVGPVPFGSYIKFNGIEICSASPERFLSKKGNKIISQPIKGTVSRSEEEDSLKIEELINSEKERAENLMIVDLVRHDLSKIAKEGSVKVSKLFEIQSFETVHQMVSTIEAEAKAATDPIKILKACFPMGSMTGAPKIAAMKAIEEIEDYRRGVYSGAIGYFTPENDFDFSVVIRTALIKSNKLVYPVGGAITADSIPEQEWEETLLKAKALTNISD